MFPVWKPTMSRRWPEVFSVNWEWTGRSPKGKTVFYNDRLGLLFVRATLSDLDTIEQCHSSTQFTCAANPHQGAIFGSAERNFGWVWATKIIGITNQPDQLVGILTSENAEVVLQNSGITTGVEELAEPEVTTSSGRQTEMRATQIITVITNFVFAENIGHLIQFDYPANYQVETGPILDTVATVLPDGYTIDLRTTASLTEFLGYDKANQYNPSNINDGR